MEKAFEFVKQLNPSIFVVLGYPTIRLYSDRSEVQFKTCNIVNARDFNIGTSYEDFCMFGKDNSIVIVFTFVY